MVPISPFSTQLQLNFLLPYNCCRYEGCMVTCTFFFWLIGFVYNGCGWQLFIHTVPIVSFSDQPCSWASLLQNTNINIRVYLCSKMRGACMITRLSPDPTLLMRALGLYMHSRNLVGYRTCLVGIIVFLT